MKTMNLAVYLVDSDGNTNRVRTNYGQAAQDAALQLLAQACPDRKQVTLEFRNPKYVALTETIVLVGDFSRPDVLRTLHWWVSRLDAKVIGHGWLVKAYDLRSEDSDCLGVFLKHDDALATCLAWNRDNSSLDSSSSMTLVEIHG